MNISPFLHVRQITYPLDLDPCFIVDTQVWRLHKQNVGSTLTFSILSAHLDPVGLARPQMHIVSRCSVKLNDLPTLAGTTKVSKLYKIEAKLIRRSI